MKYDKGLLGFTFLTSLRWGNMKAERINLKIPEIRNRNRIGWNPILKGKCVASKPPTEAPIKVPSPFNALK